jgi:primosomal protein N' (replication factor Y)
MFAEVYINTHILSLDRPFHYNIPKKLVGDAVPGVRVKVPFGYVNRLTEGIITSLTETSEFDDVKDISKVIDKMPLLTDKDINLIFKMRRDYCCSFYTAARLLLPAGSEQKKEEWVSLTDNFTEEEAKKSVERSAVQEKLLLMLQNSGGSLEMSAIRSEMGANARKSVNALVKKGIAQTTEKSITRVSEKTVKLAYYASDEEPFAYAEAIRRRSPVQAKIVEFLADGGKYSISDILSSCKCTKNSLDALALREVVKFEEVRIFRRGKELPTERSKPFEPTEEQKNVIDALSQASDGVFLIHGVTGSGKTEVYLQIVDKIIRQGKQAIILVPEISLTPQITDRFYKRFGDTVAVMHSALSLGERFDEYVRIKSGEARVVVGARSAVFAPCSNLGIIIIDEEHEYSYKSETVPKYHAADIAKMRCKTFNCPLVLASATPSVESYYKAECGEYRLLELKERYNKNPLPKVYIADMRKELEEGNRTVLSRVLAREIYQRMKKREQTILFLNRRGFSTFVSCRSCGFVYMCPNCSLSLTYHASSDSLNCHICGYRKKRDKLCPECGSDKIRDFGTGTQKAEKQIQDIFPEAKIVRMDLDTTGGKNGHEKVLSEFEDGNADMLLGTQMVSKGLDFPNVTLVGALAADSSLYSDDFRAQERTFALITQVVGRAGRGDETGNAVIQTYSPENRVLRLAADQDYLTFYKEEIAFRRAFSYPPFEHIVNIIISSEDEEKAERTAEIAAAELRASKNVRNSSVTLYGPSDAPIKKMQGRYRKRIWFKCEDEKLFSDTFREIMSKKRESGVGISIDIDPYGMN